MTSKNSEFSEEPPAQGDQSHATRSIGYNDLAPPEWFAAGSATALWVTAFRAHRVDRQVLGEELRFVDLGEVRAFLTAVPLQYVERPSNPRMDDDGHIGLIVQSRPLQTTNGVHLVLLTPYSSATNDSPEVAARHRVTEASALHAAMLGRNVVHELVFEQVVDATSGQVSAAGWAVLNPLHIPPPLVTESALSRLAAANASLVGATDSVRGRIQLSLRWYSAALADHDTDAFLKHWIALETLAMDSPDVRPLNELLADAYRLPLREVSEKFFVGRLHGVRSSIVHNGLAGGLPGIIIDYIEALYRDVLAAKINLPCLSHAAQLADVAKSAVLLISRKQP